MAYPTHLQFDTPTIEEIMAKANEASSSIASGTPMTALADETVCKEEDNKRRVRTFQLAVTFKNRWIGIDEKGYSDVSKSELIYQIRFDGNGIQCTDNRLLATFFPLSFRSSAAAKTSEQLNHLFDRYKTSITTSRVKYRSCDNNNRSLYYINVMSISEIKINISDNSPLVIIYADNCLIYAKGEYSCPDFSGHSQYVKQKEKRTEPKFELNVLVTDIRKNAPQAEIMIVSAQPNLSARLQSAGLEIPNEEFVHVKESTSEHSTDELINAFVTNREMDLSSIHTISAHPKDFLCSDNIFSTKNVPGFMYHYIRVVDESYSDIAYHLFTHHKLTISGSLSKQNMLTSFCKEYPEYLPSLAAQRLLLQAEEKAEAKETLWLAPSASPVDNLTPRSANIAIQTHTEKVDTTPTVSLESSSEATGSLPDDNNTQFLLELAKSIDDKRDNETSTESHDLLDDKTSPQPNDNDDDSNNQFLLESDGNKEQIVETVIPSSNTELPSLQMESANSLETNTSLTKASRSSIDNNSSLQSEVKGTHSTPVGRAEVPKQEASISLQVSTVTDQLDEITASATVVDDSQSKTINRLEGAHSASVNSTEMTEQVSTVTEQVSTFVKNVTSPTASSDQKRKSPKNILLEQIELKIFHTNETPLPPPQPVTSIPKNKSKSDSVHACRPINDKYPLSFKQPSPSHDEGIELMALRTINSGPHSFEDDEL